MTALGTDEALVAWLSQSLSFKREPLQEKELGAKLLQASLPSFTEHLEVMSLPQMPGQCVTPLVKLDGTM